MESNDERPEPDGISRRQLFGIGAAAAGAAAAASVVGAAIGTGDASAAPATPSPTVPAAPAGTTLNQTLVHGSPGVKGYRKVVTAPGEPLLLRNDLLGTATRGSATRTPVVTLGQLTDMHIIDAQSPARVEFIDRLIDPGQPLAGSLPFDAAYRPQEMLTTHVAESMVQAVNGVVGPVTGRPLDFTISTGDNADNTQYNELRWQIDILDGNAIRPDSGNYSKWEGIGGPHDYDTHYWHPDGTPFLGTIDKPRGTYGFPVVPGLLDRCRAPFQTTGLRTPWYTVFGNHDGLVQGNAPEPPLFSPIAIGALKVTGTPDGVDVPALVLDALSGDPRALQVLMSLGPAKIVTADVNRRCQILKQTVSEHFHTTGSPVGHGYTQNNVNSGTAYYTFDTAGVHSIVLDTVNPYGYSDGSIDHQQLTWLTNELVNNSSRYLDPSGNWVSNSGGTDRLMVIYSHHTIETMTNTIGAGRVTGATVSQLLLRFPNVVLWVNGHTHRNTVVPYARTAGPVAGSGFWEINTASHVDWPQQARIIELVDNNDGTLSIFGTIIDHAAPTAWPATPSAPLELAALSRELSANDWQAPAASGDTDGRRGSPQDRNVELLVAKPF